METSQDVSSFDCNIFASSVGLVAQDRKDFSAGHDIAKRLEESLERGTVLSVGQRGQAVRNHDDVEIEHHCIASSGFAAHVGLGATNEMVLDTVASQDTLER